MRTVLLFGCESGRAQYREMVDAFFGASRRLATMHNKRLMHVVNCIWRPAWQDLHIFLSWPCLSLRGDVFFRLGIRPDISIPLGALFYTRRHCVPSGSPLRLLFLPAESLGSSMRAPLPLVESARHPPILQNHLAFLAPRLAR